MVTLSSGASARLSTMEETKKRLSLRCGRLSRLPIQASQLDVVSRPSGGLLVLRLIIWEVCAESAEVPDRRD